MCCHRSCSAIPAMSLRAPSARLFLLGRCQGRGSPQLPSSGPGAVPAFGGAGAEIVLYVGEASEYR
jgi:hypothetical protein